MELLRHGVDERRGVLRRAVDLVERARARGDVVIAGLFVDAQLDPVLAERALDQRVEVGRDDGPQDAPAREFREREVVRVRPLAVEHAEHREPGVPGERAH